MVFDWCLYTFLWPILKVKVKVMQIWLWLSSKQRQTGQILLLLIHRKSPTCFRLAYLHFIMAHSKGQGHANCDWISCKLWWIGETLLLPIHRKAPIEFRFLYLHLTLSHSKGQGQLQFDCEKFVKLSHTIFWHVFCSYTALSCSLNLSLIYVVNSLHCIITYVYLFYALG